MLTLNRTSLWPLAFLAGVLLANPAAAKDRPIIISAGSPLDLQHADGWRVVDAQTLVTSFPSNWVRSIEVKIGPEASQTLLPFTFDHELTQIQLTYDNIQVFVQTGLKGENIRVVIGGASLPGDFQWVSPDLFRSRRTKPTSLSLSVMKNGVLTPVDVQGKHVRIAIHYGDPGDPPAPAKR